MKKSLFNYMSNFILGLVDLIFLPFLLLLIMALHLYGFILIIFGAYNSDAYNNDDSIIQIGWKIRGNVAMWMLKLYMKFLYDYDKKH